MAEEGSFFNSSYIIRNYLSISKNKARKKRFLIRIRKVEKS